MSDKRRFLRTRFDSRVRVEHPRHDAAIFRTGDVSDGGVFLQKGPYELDVGDVLSVQIQDVPGEAPVLRVRVVRADAQGYGLQFAD